MTAVFRCFYTAELTTLGRGGAPVTWPVLPIFWEKRGLFIVATSIGLPQKAFNIRRNPQVSLLYSEPTGSELSSSPAVLVQGQAQVGEQVIVGQEDAEPEIIEAMTAQALKLVQKQPAMGLYMRNPVTRYLMDWYFMRLIITITPQRIH
ncbi:hypothetical protein RY27_22445, partial [Litorilinea aerophila]